jgi:hypothetical protein
MFNVTSKLLRRSREYNYFNINIIFVKTLHLYDIFKKQFFFACVHSIHAIFVLLTRNI